MPTPVSTARQCLTPEAASLLDDAVSVAKRRSHSQTTSLHAVSALLSLPNSILRDSCARARNSAYSPRLQFKALQLSLSVSLDRLNSARVQNDDEPPVSNSLMAAIKRSQANQRRQPESFHLYHTIIQQQNSSSSSSCPSTSSTISCIKVELRNLILSILDDPVVSRVFLEAGFRSSDIKMGILRPLPQLLKFSRGGATRIPPPLFLCNLSENLDPDPRGFAFSLPGFQTVDENCRRVGEVLGKVKGKNPLLVGASAYDALKSFIESKKDGSLDCQLSGWNVVCMEKEVGRLVSGISDNWSFGSRFEDTRKMMEDCGGSSLLVNIGDLQGLISGVAPVDSVTYFVQQLKILLDDHGGHVRLIASTASYEMYLKFVSEFPSIEKDWDLQLLPITSHRQVSEGYPYSRSSLMESFVPFAGFFSAPDPKCPLSSSYPRVSPCFPFTEKDDHDASVADRFRSSLPSWLQIGELNKGKDVAKINVDRMATISGSPHHSLTTGDVHTHIQACEDGKHSRSNSSLASSTGSESKYINVGSSVDLNCDSTSDTQTTHPLAPEAKKGSLLSKLLEKPLEKSNDLEPSGFRSPFGIFNSSSMGVDDGSSSVSATYVTTDLGLGVLSSPSSNEPKSSNCTETQVLGSISGAFTCPIELASRNVPNRPAQSTSYPDFCMKYYLDDSKMLFRFFAGKFVQQGEAVSVICQAIARCRTTDKRSCGDSMREDIWLNFHGPDRFGKKKIATALAEVLYGSRDNIVTADLSSLDMNSAKNSHNLQEANGYASMFRGKNIVDYVAEELGKKPLAVVFLENVDKADPLAQNTLSRAIRTGKFSDSHGREVGVRNAIFITTSGFIVNDHYEERLQRAKGRPFQIVVGCAAMKKNVNSQNLSLSIIAGKDVSSPVVVNKRKNADANEIRERHRMSEATKRAHRASNVSLDLNLPAEKNEEEEKDHENCDHDCSFGNSKRWLDDFISRVQENVLFKPVDFSSLSGTLLSNVNKAFHEIVGSQSQCVLEVDSEVMDQLLVAAYMSDKAGAVENWVEQVLSNCFSEANRRYDLNSHSVVKLIVHKGLYTDEEAPYLPATIILN